MGKRWLVLIAVTGLVALWWTLKHRVDVMLYRGEKIKPSKSYADFDQYKNDPNNIHTSETVRVQRLVMDAPIAHSLQTELDLFRATEEIVFPGYGSGSGGGPLDGGFIIASSVSWVVRAVPRTAFYFIRSATTRFIANVFSSRNRVSPKEAFEVLEPDDGKPSCPVLRGLGGPKVAWLLDQVRPSTHMAGSCVRGE